MTALLAVTMGLATGFAATARTAMADEGDGTSADTTDVTGNGTNGTSDGTAASDAVTITIDAATPVVTSSSGYSLKATISNPTSKKLSAGTLTATTNARFTFFSRTDIQEWAEGTARIPTTDGLGDADVPAIAAGGNASVTVNVAQDALKGIVSWGPKPIEIAYVANDRIQAAAHSFLTRSTDGLNNASTPAMSLTVAMPLASTSWQLDETAADRMVADGGTSGSTGKTSSSASGTTAGESGGTQSTNGAGSDNASLITLGDDRRLERSRLQTIAKHPMLQVIADPTTLDAMGMPPQVSGIMQPAGFDIASYTAFGNAAAYQSAGVDQSAWSADAALSDYRSALGDQSADSPIYAWQGKTAWSQASLTTARAQGYSTVIADHEFDNSDNSTVHTGKIIVPTDAGDVTVLTEQRELSRLAQGKATSDAADGETSAAGRLARFVAQSAFYQMEQPYTARNLLVCLGVNADAATIDAFMSAIEQSPWLQLTDLATLGQADAYATGDDARQLVQDAATLSDAQSQHLQSTLSSLASSRATITQFTSEVVKDTSDGARAWGKRLADAQSCIAMHAMAGDNSAATRMSEASASLAKQLTDGVTITKSEPVTIVSESAKMPVTIRNQHPYAVRVRVSSLTDSPEIVTSRITETDVPAYGEAQVTFTIRVLTSGKATAHITLQDRTGQPFGTEQTTTITSVLQISDMSGFVIIALAVVLGLLGLWRQFNRKKDPDE